MEDNEFEKDNLKIVVIEVGGELEWGGFLEFKGVVIRGSLNLLYVIECLVKDWNY